MKIKETGHLNIRVDKGLPFRLLLLYKFSMSLDTSDFKYNLRIKENKVVNETRCDIEL